MFNIPTPTRVQRSAEKRREEAQRRPPWWNSRLTNRAPSPPPATQRPGPSQSVEPTLSSSPASQRSRAPPVTPDGHIDSPAHQQSGADHEPMLGDDSQASVVSRLKHLQDTVNKLLAVTDSSARRSPDKPKARLPKALTADVHQVVKTLKSRIDDPIEWDFTKQFCDAVNVQVTDEIVKAVVNDTTTATLARRASAVYFHSLKRQVKMVPDTYVASLKKQRKRQRKHNKLRRRVSAMKSSTMLTEQMKEKIRQILTADHMSSEESGSGEDEGRQLVVRPPPWRSAEAQSTIDSLDRKADRRRSERAREMMTHRVVGAASTRPAPDGPEWAVHTD